MQMSYFYDPPESWEFGLGICQPTCEFAKDTFGIEQVFELPIEPSVAEAGDAGTPFVTSPGEASKEVRKLAEAVIEERRAQPGKEVGFFRKGYFVYMYLYI